MNSWIHIYIQAYTCLFELPTFMSFHEKPHTLSNQCLFYFVWRKYHDLITIFLENKKVPLLLKVSILIEDCDFAIQILSQNQFFHLKPSPSHYLCARYAMLFIVFKNVHTHHQIPGYATGLCCTTALRYPFSFEIILFKPIYYTL